jgi:penicillin-binding protein 2
VNYGPHQLKDKKREARLFNSRAIQATVVIGLLLLLQLGQLVYLQVVQHKHFTTLSRENRVSIQPVAPTRGTIYDRNGAILAENLPSFSLELIPEQISDLEVTLLELRKLVAVEEQDLVRFRKLLKQRRPYESVPLRTRLSDREVARLAVDRHRYPGVEIQSRLVRHYPAGALAAHVTGYVGRISEPELKRLDPLQYNGISHIGKIGIERYYENSLRGEVGVQRVETNAQGRMLRVLDREAAKPGNNLYLNIDLGLQQIGYDALGEESGAVVAIDPNNGAVLAMVSSPSYDPNLFVNGIDQATYNELRDADSRPLFNRVLRGQYPPGSTLKPFIGLAGLEYNAVDGGKKMRCTGGYMLEGEERVYRDWKKWGHGETDMRKAIVESCDVYFYDLALTLGIDRMSTYLAPFGFGTPTGIDLVSEASGLLPSREWKRRARNLPWFPGETLITGIGQGFHLTTPLQLARATAMLSRRGSLVRPSVLYAYQQADEDDLQVISGSGKQAIDVIRNGNWDYIIDAMRRVVHGERGTARGINSEIQYTAAGKTGTAQVFGIKQDEEYDANEIAKKLRDHALFIAFAPVDEPQIAVAIIVENGGGGGSVAAPVARKIMDAYLLRENR